jgi:multicomponent Na+:H+ antiporter subunit F
MVEFLITALILAFAAALCLYRTIKGPTVPDRIVAVNVIATCTIVMHVLIAFIVNQPMFIDIALTYAMLSFLVTLAAARYLATGRIFV